MAKRTSKQKRIDALIQLKAAQKTLADGRAELTRAHEKIKRAQSLIDNSAQVLRETWGKGPEDD
jgi:hypothetical protein